MFVYVYSLSLFSFSLPVCGCVCPSVCLSVPVSVWVSRYLQSLEDGVRPFRCGVMTAMHFSAWVQRTPTWVLWKSPEGTYPPSISAALFLNVFCLCVFRKPVFSGVLCVRSSSLGAMWSLQPSESQHTSMLLRLGQCRCFGSVLATFPLPVTEHLSNAREEGVSWAHSHHCSDGKAVVSMRQTRT